MPTSVRPAALAATTFASRDAHDGDPAPPVSSVLRIGTLGARHGLDPRDPRADLQALMIVMEPLLHLTADRELRPALATAWRVEDGGRAIHLALRDGVLFHDGTTFGSEDVRFTLEAHWGDDLEAVQTPGPLEAVLRFAKPSADVLYDLPRILVLPNQAPVDFGARPIGTGPYAFAKAEVDSGARVTARRFEAYWGRPGHHDTVELHGFDHADLDALVDALVDDDLDLAQVPLSRKQVDRLRVAGRVALERVPSLERRFLVLNTAVAPLDDPRVRAAIDLLVPREELVARLDDEAFVVSTLLGEDSPWSDRAPPRPYDPARAQRLLDAAVPIGRTLSVHTSFDPNLVMTAVHLRDALAPHGIELEVEPIGLFELLDRAANGDFDLILLDTHEGANPAAAVANAVDLSGLVPIPNFSTPRIAELATFVQRQDVSHGAGADAFGELLGLLADEAAYVYIGAPPVYGALGVGLTGWSPHPDRALSLQDVHRIPVP